MVPGVSAVQIVYGKTFLTPFVIPVQSPGTDQPRLNENDACSATACDVLSPWMYRTIETSGTTETAGTIETQRKVYSISRTSRKPMAALRTPGSPLPRNADRTPLGA